jgi:hypothetical protein
MAEAQRLRERVQRVPVTPEWMAENAAKQAAYEQRRRIWIAECYGRNEEQTSAASESPAQAPQSNERDALARLLPLVFKNASTGF